MPDDPALARSSIDPYPCPCCGYLVFDEPPGSYGICPICFWEDDLRQLRFVAMPSAPNGVSLIDAQRNFAACGACEERLRGFVRPPDTSDRRDPGWRMVAPMSRDVEDLGTSQQEQRADPTDATVLYYWRETFWGR